MNELTRKILIAMLLGAVAGVLLKYIPESWRVVHLFSENIFNLGGNIFISLIKMIVVPMVLISIVCGMCSLENLRSLGEMCYKALFWFIVTTVLAIILAQIFAVLFNVGVGAHLEKTLNYYVGPTPSLMQLLNSIVPDNPFRAMVDANMLQIILFAILFGVAINLSGESGKQVISLFKDLNVIVMKFVMFVMAIAPYGVFCLIAQLFYHQGTDLIFDIFDYCVVVALVLALYLALVIGGLLWMNKLDPRIFFRKMYSVMLFAFGVSSSNASIPLMLETVENKLGVKNSVASFIIPLGVNMNKSGTAIAQTVAAIFIAHAYNIDIGFSGYVTLLLTASIMSISTAGVPGIGMVTLVIILKQLGLPVEGMALVVGVDRVIDMARTLVNVASNAAVACLVGKSEGLFDQKVYLS